ncbi:fibrillarin-like rRNA/tRNA 2'-O-methyltransferase [Candidatus Woesearchaeota archaeon]|jgi:fibrillarin-like pre-rRNA processing protein|nr:fibrillarin-like rRNA/tRNA 2'-O-methyltransferase [Candidatus Woesearchaeota archaeon]
MRLNEYKLKGIYVLEGRRKRYLTKNLVPGQDVYGEELINDSTGEYRVWDKTRSKLGAALYKGVTQIGIYPGGLVLYLGASTGTTVSHVSDIVGSRGKVFALDFAPRTTRELVFLCEDRKNIIPLLEDAHHPENYVHIVPEVDCVFQDIAQRNQATIFIRNCKQFLKKDGFGFLSVKSRSVDVSKNPKKIFKQIREELEKELTIVDYKELDPFEKDHCVFVIKKK